MGTVMVDWFTSLDGYGYGEGWPGYFGLEGPGMFDWVMEQQDRPYTMLMGARTYRELAPIIPTLAGDPTSESMLTSKKLVFSSSLEAPLDWPNAHVVTDDAVSYVSALKRQPGMYRTIGSLSLGRALLAAGLVDRLRVMIFPLVLGNTGRQPVYDGLPDVRLELISSRTLDGRTIVLDYAPSLIAPSAA